MEQVTSKYSSLALTDTSVSEDVRLELLNNIKVMSTSEIIDIIFTNTEHTRVIDKLLSYLTLTSGRDLTIELLSDGDADVVLIRQLLPKVLKYLTNLRCDVFIRYCHPYADMLELKLSELDSECNKDIPDEVVKYIIQPHILEPKCIDTLVSMLLNSLLPISHETQLAVIDVLVSYRLFIKDRSCITQYVVKLCNRGYAQQCKSFVDVMIPGAHYYYLCYRNDSKCIDRMIPSQCLLFVEEAINNHTMINLEAFTEVFAAILNKYWDVRDKIRSAKYPYITQAMLNLINA